MMVQEIYSIVQKISADQNMAILLVEQNVRAALSIAHYGHVLENGRIVLSGSAESLKNNEDIREFYMGLSAVGSQKSYREGQALPAQKTVAGVTGRHGGNNAHHGTELPGKRRHLAQGAPVQLPELRSRQKGHAPQNTTACGSPIPGRTTTTR